MLSVVWGNTPNVVLMDQDPSLPAEISEKQTLLKSLPAGDEELYTTYKKLEAHLEFLQLQEVRTAIALANVTRMQLPSSVSNDMSPK